MYPGYRQAPQLYPPPPPAYHPNVRPPPLGPYHTPIGPLSPMGPYSNPPPPATGPPGYPSPAPPMMMPPYDNSQSPFGPPPHGNSPTAYNSMPSPYPDLNFDTSGYGTPSGPPDPFYSPPSPFGLPPLPPANLSHDNKSIGFTVPPVSLGDHQGGFRSERQDIPRQSGSRSRVSSRDPPPETRRDRSRSERSHDSGRRHDHREPQHSSGHHHKQASPQGPAQFYGTIWPAPNFDPDRDARGLRKAMKGLGCDSRAVLNILCSRNCAQRIQITARYKQMLGRDLFKDLLSELGGNLEKTICGLMYRPGEYDAYQLRQAIKGAGTDEEALIEILSTRSNAQIRAIKEDYKRLYRRDLEKDIIGDTSFHFKTLLVSLCEGARDESRRDSAQRARDDAHRLYQAGEGRWGTDESVFNEILAAQSFSQLRLVFAEYEKMHGSTMERAVEKEFSGHIKAGLLAIVKSVKNTPAFFAERLYYSMKGLGTTDSTLIRIIVSRSEVDLALIKQDFNSRYPKTLSAMIAGDTSGKYKEALLTLVRGNR